MWILAVMALGLLAVAVGFVVSAASNSSVRRTEQLEQIEAYGYAGAGTDEPSEDGLKRLLDSLAATIGSFGAGRVTSLGEEEMQRRLIAAGFFGIGARRFNGYRILLTIGLPLLTLWLLGLLGASTLLIVICVVVAGIIGWVVPSTVLTRRAQARLETVDAGLPDLIDLLVVTIEAGVAFGQALRFASERLEGPLGEEVRLTIQEQSLGLTLVEALENWRARCDTPAVRSFVRSMVQGERLGVSIGQILRNLATEMRARQKQIVEERAQKAPVKIMFPLVFLIFPVMFVVVLGPALYRFSGTL